MNRAATSVAVFGVYLAATGLGLFLVPNTILPILGFGATEEPWVRIAGLLTGILGMYFIRASRRGDAGFFRDTIIARLIFFGGVTGLVATGAASPLLLAFGTVDLAGAAWTWNSLRS